MSKKVKRYEDGYDGYGNPSMQVTEFGDYVQYEDYARLEDVIKVVIDSPRIAKDYPRVRDALRDAGYLK